MAVAAGEEQERAREGEGASSGAAPAATGAAQSETLLQMVATEASRRGSGEGAAAVIDRSASTRDAGRGWHVRDDSAMLSTPPDPTVASSSMLEGGLAVSASEASASPWAPRGMETDSAHSQHAHASPDDSALLLPGAALHLSRIHTHSAGAPAQRSPHPHDSPASVHAFDPDALRAGAVDDAPPDDATPLIRYAPPPARESPPDPHGLLDQARRVMRSAGRNGAHEDPLGGLVYEDPHAPYYMPGVADSGRGELAGRPLAGFASREDSADALRAELSTLNDLD